MMYKCVNVRLGKIRMGRDDAEDQLLILEIRLNFNDCQRFPSVAVLWTNHKCVTTESSPAEILLVLDS